MNELRLAQELIDFIDKSPSAFHAVENSSRELEAQGFKYLDLSQAWTIEAGGSYYTKKNDSALLAFKLGENLELPAFRIIGSHTDSPGFRIKPSPDLCESGYLKLNTEVYGGPILNTWLDRPLSIAGKVASLSQNIFEPRLDLVDLEDLKLIIPNLAIHMNRQVNEGFKLNPQNHMLPILGMLQEELEEENILMNALAQYLDIERESILDFELYLYPREQGEIIGLNKEFISVGKLDNLAMLQGSLKALKEARAKEINIVVGFDNEEVGSTTKQGAASPFLRDIMERIYLALGHTREEFFQALEKSMLISSDMAHAVHPNFKEKSDLTNRPIINQGPCIKIAANQAYTSDSQSAAIYEAICRKIGIPVQKFVNRSDARGGSTIGPISSTQLAIKSVDVGNPILGMHSVRELGGVKDHYYSYQTFKEFFSL